MKAARREAKIELMKEPTDRAVHLLQRGSELLLESRQIVKELEVVPDSESSAYTADRIAYGILAAALEEGLVSDWSGIFLCAQPAQKPAATTRPRMRSWSVTSREMVVGGAGLEPATPAL